MMKWFRPKGIVAFIVVVALLLCFWLVFIDLIARSAMEKIATSIVGAEVNIDHADLRISPLGLTVHGIQVTNPDNPQMNALEVKDLIFSLETAQLFLRKVIIDEMSITGVAFATKRKKPGAVVVRQKKEEYAPAKKERLLPTMPSFSPDDIQNILEKEDLKTLALIQNAQQETLKSRESWQKKLDELPDKAKLDKYKVRIEELRKTKKGDAQSILSAGSEIKSLQGDIKKDMRALKQAQDQFNNDFATIRSQMTQIKEAPGEDARRMVKKYGPTPEGIRNISAALFGENFGTWVERSLRWYKRIGPIIQRAGEKRKDKEVTKPLRAKGVDVHFKEYTPLPDFLIRKASASVTLPQGIVKGKLNNITNQQGILGSPLTYNFSGDKLEGIKSLAINGSFNRIDPLDAKDELNLALKGFRLPIVDIGSQTLPLTLEKGVANLDMSAKILKGEIEADILSTVSSAHFIIQDSKEKSMAYSSLSSAFSRITDFSLKAHVTGTSEDYHVELSSDLEKVVKGAINNLTQSIAKNLEEELRKAVQEKINSPLNSLENDVDSLGGVKNELSGRIDIADSLLQEKIPVPTPKGGLKLPFQ
jgi:uncharacterized protein (TIGR03545 family)